MNVKKKNPNIIIVLSDQLRRHALSCYGDTNIKTENIDSFAENGVKFTSACSTYPLCVPFRYSLMTGNYAHSCMIPALGWRMSPAERTMAHEFNDNGYQTAYFGKWHLYGGEINVAGYNALEENRHPVPRSHQGGWQYWRGFDLRNSPFDTCYYADDDPTPRKIEGYQTDGLTDLFLDYLGNKRDKDKPFCAVLSVEPPHPPYEAPKDLEEKWIKKDIVLPSNFMVDDNDRLLRNTGYSKFSDEKRAEIIKERKLYYAMVENLDHNVGRINSFLLKEGLLDDTIIIFMADHGDLQGGHTYAKKSFPYEESIGIPLIVSGAGIASGIICEPVATEDLFPTIMGLAGIVPCRECPGDDFSEAVRTGKARPEREGVLLQFVWEPRPQAAFYSQVWRGFRSERYKLTMIGNFKDGLTYWQFFDLEADPYELNNLIDSPEYRDMIEKFRLLLSERMENTGDYIRLM